MLGLRSDSRSCSAVTTGLPIANSTDALSSPVCGSSLHRALPAPYDEGMVTLADPRSHLERRARRLAWGGNAWHLIEFAIAIGAGISAGSIALVAFGVDSLIEFAAGGVIVWLFSGGRGASKSAER